MNTSTKSNLTELATQIKHWGMELGFQQVAITSIDLGEHEQHLKKWLAQGYHGSMNYMAEHGNKRSRPAELLEGTLRLISVRMDYVNNFDNADTILASDNKAYISRYALGRDYHKLIRKRLSQLADKIKQTIAETVIPHVVSTPIAHAH